MVGGNEGGGGRGRWEGGAFGGSGLIRIPFDCNICRSN